MFTRRRLVSSSSADAQGAECVSGLRESGALCCCREKLSVCSGRTCINRRTGGFLPRPILADVQKGRGGADGLRPGVDLGRVQFIVRRYPFGAASPHRTLLGRKASRVRLLDSVS